VEFSLTPRPSFAEVGGCRIRLATDFSPPVSGHPPYQAGTLRVPGSPFVHRRLPMSVVYVTSPQLIFLRVASVVWLLHRSPALDLSFFQKVLSFPLPLKNDLNYAFGSGFRTTYSTSCNCCQVWYESPSGRTVAYHSFHCVFRNDRKRDFLVSYLFPPWSMVFHDIVTGSPHELRRFSVSSLRVFDVVDCLPKGSPPIRSWTKCPSPPLSGVPRIIFLFAPFPEPPLWIMVV